MVEEPLLSEAFERAEAQLLDTIERLEKEICPFDAADGYAFESGLTAYDLRRVLRCRDRWPHWREERRVPPLMVEKLLARDGHYGPAQQQAQMAFDGQ